jgi:hypothetical protein
MMRNVLLLTATVTPLEGIPSLARTDPTQRLEDYRLALAFYIKLLGVCFDALVFAENSNSDISALKALVADAGCANRVEFISFHGLDFPPKFGRGYGEFRLIKHAVDQSRILAEASVIWKVTGRYIIENIAAIVGSMPPDVDLYCHMRNWPYRLCELYLLAWDRHAYETVIANSHPSLRNDIVPDTHTVEEALFRKLIEEASDDIRVQPRFTVVPIVKGIRGWDNSDYSSRWSPKILARHVANYLIPSFWI